MKAVNNKNIKGIVKYLASLKEVEGVLLTIDSNGVSNLTVVCYKRPNNLIVTNIPVIINDSKSYDINRPTYYNDKLVYSEILFDRKSRLSIIKDEILCSTRKLTI